MPSLAEFGPVILVKFFLNFVNVFWLIRYYLPLEKGKALHLNKREFLMHRNALCHVGLELAHGFWRRRFLKILLMYFRYFNIFSPWKSARSFLWTNFNLLHPRMLFAKFGWNWPVVLKKNFKFCQYFFTLSLFISPKKKCEVLSFEQFWIPLTQVPKLVEIGPVVLKKKMWKVYDNDDDYDDNNDDDVQRTNWDQKRSRELLALVS